ncbi:nucleoid-associated protein [Cronobacter muytjensii]|uniref:nucleoid-associated protein n=1 Tax=Cronobacter muytjensii TaxID=413501 RepID=UPI00142C23F5|nr:nucleoid-associated protein [Cronobacter muytjensii]KAB1471302.1 nucleoid-associated protein [Cronobacter sakazakii]
MSKPQIKHVIVHELIKESGSDFNYSNPYNLRKTELDKKNDTVNKLVEDVITLYGSRGNTAHYGVFKSDENKGPIPEEFHKYFSLPAMNSEEFISLTRQIMHQLFESAKGQTWPSGGYIVFTDYISQGVRFLLITMIKKKGGMRISPALEPEEMVHLDLSNINQAAKINFHLYDAYIKANNTEKTELSFLSFVSKNKGQSASAYFIAALGCDKGIASSAATRTLPREARNFFKSIPEIKNVTESFRNKVIKYLDEKQEAKQPAKLADIADMASAHLTFVEEDRRKEIVDDFMKHLNSEKIRIPSEFIIHKPTLDKVKNVSFKDKLFSFNFDKELLGDTSDAMIYYDEENGSLSFNRLPVEAKTKIEAAIKERKKALSASNRDIQDNK